MRGYAFALLVLAAVFVIAAYIFPGYRKAAFAVAGASFVLSLILFGVDCGISCVRTGELYVPKR
jgi:hypothetical protein